MNGTPTWESGNDTVLKATTSPSFLLANILILLTTSIVGIGANIFVILAVYHQKSLQTWNNALVVNLAVIDVLRCAIDCPLLLSIILTVKMRGSVNELICDAQVASFSFSCCIQLLTLASISAERYQAIAQPFKTSQRRKRIMFLIPFTWILAILVACFCLVFVKDSPVQVRCKGLPRGTSSTSLTINDTFGLYILFPLWAACFSLITGFYARIFFLVRSHNRKIFDEGTFLVSTKEKKRIERETAVQIEVQGKPEQVQTLSQSVAEIEIVPQEKTKSSRNDSISSLLTLTKDPHSVSVCLENGKELKTPVEKAALETQQPQPSDTQVRSQIERKPIKTEQSNPPDMKSEAKASRSVSSTGVKSSTTKPQKVSNTLETEKQPKERLKTGKSPLETEKTNPPVPSLAQVENPESSSVLPTEQKQAKKSSRGEALAVVTEDQVSSLTPVSINVPETAAAKQSVEVEGAVCMMPSKASKERANKKKESKMAKRAGYIIATFLIFWLPLITTILVNLVVHRQKNTPIISIKDVEILAVSVACITSLSDPIIYAAVNPQFRSEFYRIKNRVKSIFSKE